MTFDTQSFKNAAVRRQAEMIAFAQKLVQTPSLPGQETAIAALIQTEMKRLDYDDVSTDNYGNVIGLVKGLDGPSIMFNGHMDHVDPGDKSGWPYPPFSGAIVNGELWGRGSVDMKGPVACMVYAPAIIKSMGILPPGNIYVVTPVMEEVGGVGSTYLATHLHTALAIVGEPSHNTLRRGHRGRVELWITVTGKSIHASIPQLGINPHFTIANFLRKLQTLKMVKDDTFGGSSVAPTLLSTDQMSPNVTPGQITLTLDWRNTPSETPEAILQKASNLLQESLLDGAQGSVTLATRPFTTYTGITVEQSAVFPSFELALEHPLVQQAQKSLSAALEAPTPIDIWPFATDGGHLMAAGIPTLGFGPGDETLAHTNREHIVLADMALAMRGYAALAMTDWQPLLAHR